MSRKWDSRNLRTISTLLRIDEAAEIQRICERSGISQYCLIQRFLRAIITADRKRRQRCEDLLQAE